MAWVRSWHDMEDLPDSSSALHLLRNEFSKHWMVITNEKGEVAPRSLRRHCAKRGLPAEGDDASLLSSLLRHLREADECSAPPPRALPKEPPLSEEALSDAFAALCGASGRLSFEEWMSWPWLAERVGPAGTQAQVTAEAAKVLWKREASHVEGVELQGFVRLAAAVQEECRRATAIQAVLRGRAGRKSAEVRVSARTHPPCEAVLAPFNPTPPCAIGQALDALDVRAGDVFYDLGCGDGRVLLQAAQRGAACVGVEYDAELAARARAAAAAAGVACCDASSPQPGAIAVVHGDACSCDLTPADKIFLYLVPAGLQHMRAALDAALERGVPIASYTFSLPGVEPFSTLTAPTRAPECKVRLYRRS